MDILRPELKRGRTRRRWVIGGAIGLVAIAVAVALARLEPAAPTVERSTVWIGKVERGEMLRQVRGTGTLVPEQMQWIPAQTNGRVDRRLLEPGAVVGPGSEILALSNPQVEQEALDAESRQRIAEAELATARAQLESQAMTLRADLATVGSEAQQARLQAEADEELAKNGLISNVELKMARARAESWTARAAIEKERQQVFANATTAQIAAKQAELDQTRALADLRQRLRDSLRVRAGIAGVLQEVAVEVGQQVTPGMTLARVAEPSRLMARLRVPATQARDVVVGQKTAVDTRNGIVEGKVARIDPSVREGTVTVDVTLTGELPRGARPDLAVDGTIEIERIAETLYVGRPAFGQEQSTVGLFRLDPDGSHARRVQVQLGRSSVSTIEVVQGLAPGDEVILSETTRWDEFERIRLK